MKHILIITDNEEMYEQFKRLVIAKNLFCKHEISYACSYGNKVANLIPIDVNTQADLLIDHYDLVISLHCKQIFPQKVVKNQKCINIHPGLNPYNRGMFPHVFSLINDLPCGATIHEIDDRIDHGKVICQQEVEIESCDTSLTLYHKVVRAEIELLDKYLEAILDGKYEAYSVEEGNVNLLKDYRELCELDLMHEGTLWEHIKLLRALSHGDHKNAYFFDDAKRKVYVKIEMYEST